MIISGKTWKYGDDVNTDVIFPGRFTYNLMSDEDMGRHALIDLDTVFNQNMQPGEIIIGGKNWGCGSSREQAVKCLKARGVGAIIAKGFARIYYRNALNEGLATIVCPEAVMLSKPVRPFRSTSRETASSRRTPNSNSRNTRLL